MNMKAKLLRDIRKEYIIIPPNKTEMFQYWTLIKKENNELIFCSPLSQVIRHAVRTIYSFMGYCQIYEEHMKTVRIRKGKKLLKNRT